MEGNGADDQRTSGCTYGLQAVYGKEKTTRRKSTQIRQVNWLRRQTRSPVEFAEKKEYEIGVKFNLTTIISGLTQIISIAPSTFY